MNTLWLYDRDRWNGYNRYDLSYDFPTNQQFIERYDQEVPAGTLWATCTDQPVGNGLQPTQIIAEIPEGYDTMFELQWGGGSLLHLKGRLQTMGCVPNNISIRNSDTNLTYATSLYDMESTSTANQRFAQTYEQFIPPGPLQADCYDICEISDEGCLSFEQLKERENGFQELFRIISIFGDDVTLDQTLSCNDDFSQQIKDQVLPFLPIHPHTCIIKQTGQGRSGFGGYAITYPGLDVPPFIFSLQASHNIYRTDTEYEIIGLQKEIHELCHMNQFWGEMQMLGLGSRQFEDSHDFTYIYDTFYERKHIKEFMDMTGFTNKWGRIPSGRWDDGGWYLSADNIYRNVYSSNPMELSAELCSMYFLDKMGLESNYRYVKHHYTDFGKYKLATNIRDFDTNPYLTPEVVEWLETYMILPPITEEDAE